MEKSIIDDPTLVLNKHWQPLLFTTVKVSIVSVMRGRALVMDPDSFCLLTFDEWVNYDSPESRWIQTTSIKIAAPEVIVLKDYGARPIRRINFNKPNMCRRDNWMCQYCGTQLPTSKLTVEHVVPVSRGGKTTWNNCVSACRSCNERKADRTPAEAGMRLMKHPRRPSWNVKLKLPGGKSFQSWKPFLAKELDK